MKPSFMVPEVIENKILLIRGQKVMLDFHLAELYQVETKALKRAVKRNRERFPEDFCFELSVEELENLRYHFGTSSWEEEGIHPTRSRSKALPCYRVFCIASGRFR